MPNAGQKPSQYLTLLRVRYSLPVAMLYVALFSSYESTVTSSEPYLVGGRGSR